MRSFPTASSSAPISSMASWRSVDGIDWTLKTKMGIRNNRYVVDVPTVTGQPKRQSALCIATKPPFCRSHTKKKLKFTLPGPMTICDTLADAHFGRRSDMAMAFAEIAERRGAANWKPAAST